MTLHHANGVGEAVGRIAEWAVYKLPDAATCPGIVVDSRVATPYKPSTQWADPSRPPGPTHREDDVLLPNDETS